MTIEEKLRKGEVWLEAVNAQDLDGIVADAAESYVGYAPDQPEPRKGRQALRELFRQSFTAFPDLCWEAVRSFGQGDWTCVEIAYSGTHKGPMPGPGGEMIPATNKPVRGNLVIVSKWEGDQVAETRAYYDQLGLMAQLGLAP